ncbi:TetR/AcrR family transcriptional regulator [Mesorhizobium sp. CAU 1732]|uniref:TetR/AcrR family transcriptional regulator n=1 Tax=Mesorhizobium sp. CAU 1732 TaxID=3140358 RepID=UPI0032606E32
MNKVAAKRMSGGEHRTPERLSRTDWIMAARDALISGGVHAVKVDLISNRLKITRGSFYWHFKSRAELLGALLELWESQNTKPFEEVAQRTDVDAVQKFADMVRIWLDENDFDPAFDAAVRDWARSSPSVTKRIMSIDAFRMSQLEKVFQDMGYEGTEAMVRARVTYYHQIGYYALDVHESKARRRELLPYYLEILMGSRGDLQKALQLL